MLTGLRKAFTRGGYTRRPFGLRRVVVITTAFTLVLALTGCRTTAGPTAEPTGPSEATAGASAEAEVEVTPGSGEVISHTELELVSNARQLIFEGKRSGEGYFSADGGAMVYQAERDPANPFYEIYLLDLETGDTERISPGYGKTTCAWVHPDGQKVLFASTHQDPEARDKMQAELDFRASGEERRYSWDYDETYDIYEVAIGESEYTNLTNSPGYDAEGSWSPDGRRIVFASNRLAYTEPMSDEDREAFEGDPSYMMDIYIMDADGGNVQRLTESKGYDGGPFFSPDGRRIVWRSFTPDGLIAEIWTMDLDGSDKRQLTAVGAMSWAPFYHPSGDYVIFTTNIHGFDNFELYMVDVEGEKDPVRVTFTDGPDILPVFSPDGDQLSWVSRRGDGNAQIFLADWNDAKARELLALSPERGKAPGSTAAADVVTPDLDLTVADIRADDARLYVEALASEEMGGRMTGTPGELKATEYVAEAFQALGLEPAGDEGFFQPFAFTSGVSLAGVNALSFKDEEGEEIEPEPDVDWRPLAFSKIGPVGHADVVFAGYGIVAPEDGEQAAYDAYGEMDVAGKWVVVLRYLPEDISPERRQHLSRHSSLRFKAMEARERGAVGIIIVSGPRSQVREELVPLHFDGAVAGASITAISITDEQAQTLMAGSGKDLAQVQEALDGGEVVPGFDLPGLQVGAYISLTFDEAEGRNVLARLQVGDEPSDEIVVVGAHVDHLGHGEAGDSLATSEEEGQVHFGADDDASGVAGVLEIAQYLADREERGELDEDVRDFLFATWSGEELGLLGSSHFVKTFGDGEEETIYPAVTAYLNMDMIGRLEKQLIIQGVGSSSVWKGEIERRNVVMGLPVTPSEDTYLPTDATSFYLKGVPILNAFTGVHSEYHTPRDTAGTLDYESLAKVARLMELIAESVAKAEEPPDYIEVKAPEKGPSREGRRVYLGTVPDMAETGGGGVLLSGVAKDGPADEAGVQGGDTIVELAGQSIDNLYDYSHAIEALKIGQEATIVVLRDGERLELQITPRSRE